MDATKLIPVIDISGNTAEDVVAKQLVDAATKHGFLYIKNEGKDIPVEAIENMFEIVSLTTSTFWQPGSWHN